MPKNEQTEVQPLTPRTPTYVINKNRNDGLPPELIQPCQRRHRKYILCCGCTTALILMLLVIFLVLFFTVFTARSPDMIIETVKVEGLDKVNWTDIRPFTNVTVLARVAVKNKNIATFKFQNATTVLHYDGNFIGLAESPRATAKAGKTLRFNVTMDILIANILNVSSLQEDYLSGILPVNSYTRLSGKVKIFNIIKRNFVVRTNCTSRVNVTSYMIIHRSCKKKENPFVIK
ncbi:OLC1v1029890C1 [Oldenlandia corymbosa var. corymbosa]|uniref:OLC1v1029890C1 n=1 Tax=Oldenlandia corymbosa var. corymbosa TaxID=529605 RepID=A0AAV1CER5_OLDCO|nr:OLC1v1029890C1 [Oldenlandia corymbosa var. corymbosa]